MLLFKIICRIRSVSHQYFLLKISLSFQTILNLDPLSLVLIKNFFVNITSTFFWWAEFICPMLKLIWTNWIVYTFTLKLLVIWNLLYISTKILSTRAVLLKYYTTRLNYNKQSFKIKLFHNGLQFYQKLYFIVNSMQQIALVVIKLKFSVVKKKSNFIWKKNKVWKCIYVPSKPTFWRSMKEDF